MRLFLKHGWQTDTDCRLVYRPPGIGLVIAPPIPTLPPYRYEGPGFGRGGRQGGNPGSFRKCYLRKAVRWMKQWARKHSFARQMGKYNWA